MNKPIGDQRVVFSRKEVEEAIAQLKDPEIKKILLRHLPVSGTEKGDRKKREPSSGRHPTKNELEDARLHEINLMKGVPPEDR